MWAVWLTLTQAGTFEVAAGEGENGKSGRDDVDYDPGDSSLDHTSTEPIDVRVFEHAIEVLVRVLEMLGGWRQVMGEHGSKGFSGSGVG